ncbi:hypothetical protein JM18_007346 [Phytophthora kernoviae]|nr:hypothetical protein JM18_007346 [Phytophthora kernoviae]
MTEEATYPVPTSTEAATETPYTQEQESFVPYPTLPTPTETETAPEGSATQEKTVEDYTEDMGTVTAEDEGSAGVTSDDGLPLALCSSSTPIQFRGNAWFA